MLDTNDQSPPPERERRTVQDVLDQMLTALRNLQFGALRRLGRHWRSISVTASLIAFAVTTLLMWYSFDQTLKSTERIATVQLSRDLRKEFRETKVCDAVLDQITACQPVYRSNGGPLDHLEINDCLNFLDDVGYYVERGALDLTMADHLFGAAILEITLTPELAKYIDDVAANEEGAFSSVRGLSQRIIDDIPRHSKLIRSLQTPCERGGGDVHP